MRCYKASEISFIRDIVFVESSRTRWQQTIDKAPDRKIGKENSRSNISYCNNLLTASQSERLSTVLLLY